VKFSEAMALFEIGTTNTLSNKFTVNGIKYQTLHNYVKWFAFHGMIPFKVFYFTNKTNHLK